MLYPKNQDHGRRLLGACHEPMIFHCNYYNYWLQKNLLINPEFGMEEAIRNAATVQGYAVTQALAETDGLEGEDLTKAGAVQYARQGFGTLQFCDVSAQGAFVVAPTSHYGQCLFSASGGNFVQAQNIFDQGYAAGVLAAANQLQVGSYAVHLEACHSMGDAEGRFNLTRQDVPRDFFSIAAEGQGASVTSDLPEPFQPTSVEEASIHHALSTLDFSGNEEGLIPRFGVMLTDHFANFYNRISFHFLKVLENTGLRALAEELLVEAGHRCAFNTFGGIMISPEWQAVVQPMCKTLEDWVHGIVAVVNTFGWGIWRVHSLTPDQLVIRIYDDYESRGFLGMYGQADHPICFLASGGTAGIMNLIFTGNISSVSQLNNDFYLRIFESSDRFEAHQTQCMAMGAPFTEIVAERR